MAPSSENEEQIRRLFSGVWNGEDLDVADELVAPQYVIHDRELAEELQGPELYIALAEGTRELFPDMTFTVEDVLTEGERVAVRWVTTGTHDVTVFGEEPTGEEVTLPGIEIDRFENGKLVETWAQSDMLGLKQQVESEQSSE